MDRKTREQQRRSTLYVVWVDATLPAHNLYHYSMSTEGDFQSQIRARRHPFVIPIVRFKSKRDCKAMLKLLRNVANE
jgi:hypothetical protein